MAVNRLLRKDGEILDSHRQKINDIIGTDDWEQELYHESSQMTLFRDPDKERVSIHDIASYLKRRLKTIFLGVAEHALTLRNPLNNSPFFLLCFAVSNPDTKAIRLSLKAVDHIPLIDEIVDPDLSGIDWAIVEGESGPRAKIMLRWWLVLSK